MGNSRVWWLAGVGALAACQPMYRGRPEPLVRAGDHRPHREPVADFAAPPAYVDTCTVQFHEPPDAPRPPPPQPGTMGPWPAGQPVPASALAPGPSPLGRLLHLRAVLASDPYDARATLDLAISYDQVWRRGCALALLHRLDDLANHPQFAGGAQAEIARVVRTPSLFEDYRAAALAALGQ